MQFLQNNLNLNQLLSIIHDITSFDSYLKVRGVFLDIYKAFDKVWHDGLATLGSLLP